MEIKKSFDKQASRKYTPQYNVIRGKVERLAKKIKCASDEDKPLLIEEWKTARKEMLATPSKMNDDKKLKYVRYADDFLVAINGSKEDCDKIKSQLITYVKDTLKMELSDEKTYITHSNEKAQFLGYDIIVRRSNEIKPKGKHTSRTLNNKVQLLIPLERKVQKFLFSNGIVEVKNNNIEPCKRGVLTTLTDLEIVSTYNAELRGICNYYNLASNFYKLSYFSYLMEYSCLKTLAAKHKTTIAKIKEKYKGANGKWAIPYETKEDKKHMYFANYKECKKNTYVNDEISKEILYHLHTTTTFESRLKANKCELCGNTKSKRYEVHHINKVKNLSGKKYWEQIMIAKRRKTLVVCEECHKKIHSN